MYILGYGIGFVVLIVFFWPIYKAITGTWNVLKFIEGADSRPSSSKLQWFLWTVVIIFAYIAVYATRILVRV